MLQIVLPRQRGVFEQFLGGLLTGNKLAQDAERNRIAQEQLKIQKGHLAQRQDEAKFEMEQALLPMQIEAALSNAQLQANPGLAQDPGIGALLGQVGNANAPPGAVQALPQAINEAQVNQAFSGGHVDVGRDPAGETLVGDRLGVDVAACPERPHEQLDRGDLPGSPVDNLRPQARELHEHLLPGPVHLAHRRGEPAP